MKTRKKVLLTCRICRRTTMICELLAYHSCEDCWVLRTFSPGETHHMTELEKEAVRSAQCFDRHQGPRLGNIRVIKMGPPNGKKVKDY